MINMLRVEAPADRAAPTLRADEILELGDTDAVAVSQVILPRTPVEPVTRLSTARVVAGLAVRMSPVA
jgi:hypothetical protein